MEVGTRGSGPGTRKAITPPFFVGLALLFAAAGAAAASRPAVEQARIDWLLAEVGNSKAVFLRNGKEYDASKAVSHLKTKLLFAGKRVQTARDFIVGVASHSEETGKPYEIRFSDGTRKPMEVWLLERLAVHEKGEAARKPPGSTPSPSGRGPG